MAYDSKNGIHVYDWAAVRRADILFYTLSAAAFVAAAICLTHPNPSPPVERPAASVPANKMVSTAAPRP